MLSFFLFLLLIKHVQISMALKCIHSQAWSGRCVLVSYFLKACYVTLSLSYGIYPCLVSLSMLTFDQGKLLFSVSFIAIFFLKIDIIKLDNQVKTMFAVMKLKLNNNRTSEESRILLRKWFKREGKKQWLVYLVYKHIKLSFILPITFPKKHINYY